MTVFTRRRFGFQRRRVTLLSLIHIFIAGSIAGFTAYVWLLHHESPTKVGTYAYVNPVVAVTLGYFIGNESVGPRTLLGTLLILISVITITTMPKKRALRAHENEDSPPTLRPTTRHPETGTL